MNNRWCSSPSIRIYSLVHTAQCVDSHVDLIHQSQHAEGLNVPPISLFLNLAESWAADADS